VHCYATDNDDPTEMPRWGRVGKQRIIDEGPLKPFPNMGADHQGWQKGREAKYDMETFDAVLHSKAFMDKAKTDGKSFFIWHNTTRMHVFTYLSQKYQAKMNYESNYGLEEAGMQQMDDDIGDLLKHLDDIGVTDNTIVIFTTDNGNAPEPGHHPKAPAHSGHSGRGGRFLPILIGSPTAVAKYPPHCRLSR
jgi:arylsulfatase A-like enzyme